MESWSMKSKKETIQKHYMPRRHNSLLQDSERAQNKMNRNSTPLRCNTQKFKTNTCQSYKTWTAQSSKLRRDQRNLMKGAQQKDKHLYLIYRH